MDFSKTEHIASVLTTQFPEVNITYQAGLIQPFIEIEKSALVTICKFLQESPDFYFDYLNLITAHDNGPENGSMELWYHISSIPNDITVVLKVVLERGTDENPCEIDSLTSLWKTADWHEREAFDLLGVHFKNHPDLRRILLPADWEGHPLRKDYTEAETYHEIKIKY